MGTNSSVTLSRICSSRTNTTQTRNSAVIFSGGYYQTNNILRNSNIFEISINVSDTQRYSKNIKKADTQTNKADTQRIKIDTQRTY